MSFTSTPSAFPAGTNVIGKVGIDQTTPYTTNAVGTPDATASGSLTTNTSAITGQYVTLALNSHVTAAVQFTGTWIGTLTFQGSIDGGTTWFTVYANAATSGTGGLGTATESQSAQSRLHVAGCSHFRVGLSAYTSGTVNVFVRATTAYWAFQGLTVPPVTLFLGTSNPVISGNGTSTTGTLRVSLASDSTGQVAAIGKAAAGATISGAPVLNGGAARTANPAAVTDGQVANVMLDKLGKQVTVSALRELVGIQQTTIASSTTETTIVTAVASTFCDLTSLTITNSSGTATLVTLKDAIAGTTRAVYAIAANGGITIPFNPPLPQAAVNTAWTITCGTSVDSLYISATYVKNI